MKTKHSYYRCSKEYGGLKLDQAGRLKRLEKNSRCWLLTAPHGSVVPIDSTCAEQRTTAMRKLFSLECKWVPTNGHLLIKLQGGGNLETGPRIGSW